MNSEPNGIQCNFLIDERHSTGKGANAVISMLHFYLKQNGIGEKTLFMHADNCSGQNKNNMMMWYLMWRVLTDLHSEINLSFLIAGHTKFSPDGGFGLIKRRFNKTEINCLMDIVEVVESSSKMNTAVLVGTENSNECYVPTYDWSTYLGQYFTKLPALKCYHHFKFTNDGMVGCKKTINSPEVSVNILKKSASVKSTLPNVIQSPGLTPKRQWYLHDSIREYVSDKFKDTVAPMPAVPKPTSADDGEEEDTTDNVRIEPVASTSAAKRPNVPSKGHKQGKIKKTKA